MVTIPVSATTADVQLRFTGNTGAPSGQVAELEVCGTPAPNPDLVVSAVTWSPTSPSEVSPVTLSAVVQNIGSASAGATTVNFTLAGAVVGSAPVGALAAGASTTVSFNAGTRPMGSYAVSAVVDPANTIVEQNNGNNSFTAASPLVVAQAPGPDLQVLGIASNPPNPAVGASVTFTVAVRNRGTAATGATTVTRLVAGSTTLNTNTASIAAGATVTVAVSGSWTATSGGATLTATADATNVVAETNETNNAFSQSIVVGRGAAVPYVSYEAEAGRYQGTLLEADPLRTFGHTNFATESSGRKSVRLTSTGQFVEFTSANQANSIVVRNSIPDAPGGGGIEATISLYVNDVFSRKLTLSSKHSWLYGNTDGPEALTNTPQADARRLFDESNALLAPVVPGRHPVQVAARLGRHRRLLRHRHDRPGAGGAGGEPAGRLHLDHVVRCGPERRARRHRRHPAGGDRRPERRHQLRLDPGRAVAAGAEDPDRRPAEPGQHNQVGHQQRHDPGRRHVALAALHADRAAERGGRHQPPARGQLRLRHRQQHPDLRHRHLRLRPDPRR